MSPDTRDAIDVACGVGGSDMRTYRPVEVVRKPVSPQIMRHRLIAFLQEMPEDWTVRELLDDLRDGLNVEGG